MFPFIHKKNYEVSKKKNQIIKYLKNKLFNWRLCDRTDEIAKTIKSHSELEQQNQILNEGFQNFSKAITILGDFKELTAQRLESKVCI